MNSVNRWLDTHCSAPLDRIYHRVDEHAASLDGQYRNDTATRTRTSRR